MNKPRIWLQHNWTYFSRSLAWGISLDLAWPATLAVDLTAWTLFVVVGPPEEAEWVPHPKRRVLEQGARVRAASGDSLSAWWGKRIKDGTEGVVLELGSPDGLSYVQWDGIGARWSATDALEVIE